MKTKVIKSNELDSFKKEGIHLIGNPSKALIYDAKLEAQQKGFKTIYIHSNFGVLK